MQMSGKLCKWGLLLLNEWGGGTLGYEVRTLAHLGAWEQADHDQMVEELEGGHVQESIEPQMGIY